MGRCARLARMVTTTIATREPGTRRLTRGARIMRAATSTTVTSGRAAADHVRVAIPWSVATTACRLDPATVPVAAGTCCRKMITAILSRSPCSIDPLATRSRISRSRRLGCGKGLSGLAGPTEIGQDLPDDVRTEDRLPRRHSGDGADDLFFGGALYEISRAPARSAANKAGPGRACENQHGRSGSQTSDLRGSADPVHGVRHAEPPFISFESIVLLDVQQGEWCEFMRRHRSCRPGRDWQGSLGSVS